MKVISTHFYAFLRIIMTTASLCAALVIFAPCQVNAEITFPGNPDKALVLKTRTDYTMMAEIYECLTKKKMTLSCSVYFSDDRDSFSGVDLGNGTAFIKTSTKRGVICHELMHVFAYTIEDRDVRDEFLCAVAGYLVDGHKEGTVFVRKGV